MTDMLSCDIEKRLGDFSIAARFDIADGATALFGPSGAGKTGIVNMIAGLVRPDRGRIAFGDDVLFDSAVRIDVAPHKRRIGYVFQEGRLFPHLSVLDNITLAPNKVLKISKEEAQVTAQHLLNRFDLAETQRWDDQHLGAFWRWVTGQFTGQPCHYF